jgi:Domain of unknown function (DUF4396)
MKTATPHTPHQSGDVGANLNRTAFSATVHCLTGCAIGEILGMVLSTWWGWSNSGNVVLSVSLAFVFGYSLTMLPLLRAGLTLRRSLPLAFASDTLSIGTMELLDTLIILIVPGAINAGLGEPLFWGSLAGALLVAFCAAFPVNRALIARGKGHAVIHAYHSATTPTVSDRGNTSNVPHARAERTHV